MISSLISQDSEYLSHLGLSHNPFPVVPDETCIFLSGRIEQIVAEIVHGVIARKGFMMLTGDIGLGKTTISRRIISILEEKGVETALVLHTSLQDAELLQEINRDFGIKGSNKQSKPASLGAQLRELNQFLLAQNSQNKNCAIIIDDAQNLNQQSLELVRMISNLEGEHQKLVQILLIGQPELAQRLNTHELRQLRSRVVISVEARPLDRQELKEYIHFKLNSAGNRGQASVTSWAVHQIYRYTHGNFRRVNMLMDRCLYVTCLKNLRVINRRVVQIAHNDLFPDAKLKIVRWLAATAIPVVLMGTLGWGKISGGFDLGRFTSNWSSPSAQITESQVKPPPTNPLPDTSANKNGAAVSTLNQSQKAFIEFFSPYGLNDYAEKFQRAINNGETTRFTDELLQATGYQLVELQNLPPAIQQNFGVLNVPDAKTGGQMNFILWQPSIRIEKFYYYYKGTEINHLQSLLAKANLYHDRLDDIVGPHLMRAVVDFQKINGLPVTGLPDAATLFLLSYR